MTAAPAEGGCMCGAVRYAFQARRLRRFGAASPKPNGWAKPVR